MSTSYCLRENLDVPVFFSSFIKVVSIPLFTAFSRYLNSIAVFDNCVDQADANFAYWMQMIDNKVL